MSDGPGRGAAGQTPLELDLGLGEDASEQGPAATHLQIARRVAEDAEVRSILTDLHYEGRRVVASSDRTGQRAATWLVSAGLATTEVLGPDHQWAGARQLTASQAGQDAVRAVIERLEATHRRAEEVEPGDLIEPAGYLGSVLQVQDVHRDEDAVHVTGRFIDSARAGLVATINYHLNGHRGGRPSVPLSTDPEDSAHVARLEATPPAYLHALRVLQDYDDRLDIRPQFSRAVDRIHEAMRTGQDPRAALAQLGEDLHARLAGMGTGADRDGLQAAVEDLTVLAEASPPTAPVPTLPPSPPPVRAGAANAGVVAAVGDNGIPAGHEGTRPSPDAVASAGPEGEGSGPDRVQEDDHGAGLRLRPDRAAVLADVPARSVGGDPGADAGDPDTSNVGEPAAATDENETGSTTGPVPEPLDDGLPPAAPALSPEVQDLVNHAFRCGFTPLVEDPNPDFDGRFAVSLLDPAGEETLLLAVSPDQAELTLFGLPDRELGNWTTEVSPPTSPEAIRDAISEHAERLRAAGTLPRPGVGLLASRLVAAEPALHQLRADLAKATADLDTTLAGPVQQGQPSVAEASLLLLEAVYTSTRHHLGTLTDTPAWQQAVRVWESTKNAWTQIRESVQARGEQWAEQAETWLRQLADRAAQVLTRVADHLTTRLDQAGAEAPTARQMLGELAAAGRTVRNRLNPDPNAAEAQAWQNHLDLYRMLGMSTNAQFRATIREVDAEFAALAESIHKALDTQSTAAREALDALGTAGSTRPTSSGHRRPDQAPDDPHRPHSSARPSPVGPAAAVETVGPRAPTAVLDTDQEVVVEQKWAPRLAEIEGIPADVADHPGFTALAVTLQRAEEHDVDVQAGLPALVGDGLPVDDAARALRGRAIKAWPQTRSQRQAAPVVGARLGTGPRPGPERAAPLPQPAPRPAPRR